MEVLAHTSRPELWGIWKQRALARCEPTSRLAKYLHTEDVAWIAEGHDIRCVSEWVSFYNQPSVQTATAFLLASGVPIPMTSVREPLFRRSLNAVWAAAVPVHGGGNRPWLDSNTPLVELKKDMATFIEYDALHDVVHGAPPTDRIAIHDMIRGASADADCIATRSAVATRSKTLNAFLQARLTEVLDLPIATKLSVRSPDTVLMDLAMCTELAPLLKCETLEVVLDGVLTRTEIKLVNAVMAATVLLTLHHLSVYALNEAGGGNFVRDPASPLSSVRHIRFVTGMFMGVDGLDMVPFYERYVKTIQVQTYPWHLFKTCRCILKSITARI